MLAEQKGLKATAFLEMTLLDLARERLTVAQFEEAERPPKRKKG
jgi:hypothetical protein